MSRFRPLFIFILKNFGPILGFYIINQIWGYKLAIIISILLVILDFVILKINKEKVTILFLTFNSIIIVFGILDLLLSSQYFFKYEAFILNTILGLFWFFSIFREKSIVQEIAESQGKTDNIQSVDKKFFFNFFTIFWAIFFLAKGIILLWLNQKMEIQYAFALRLFFEKISFWIMLGISTLLPRKIWNFFEWLRIFPSQRNKNLPCM